MVERGGEEEGRKGVALEKVKVSFLRQKAKSSAHTCVSFFLFLLALFLLLRAQFFLVLVWLVLALIESTTTFCPLKVAHTVAQLS